MFLARNRKTKPGRRLCRLLLFSVNRADGCVISCFFKQQRKNKSIPTPLPSSGLWELLGTSCRPFGEHTWSWGFYLGSGSARIFISIAVLSELSRRNRLAFWLLRLGLCSPHCSFCEHEALSNFLPFWFLMGSKVSECFRAQILEQNLGVNLHSAT